MQSGNLVKSAVILAQSDITTTVSRLFKLKQIMGILEYSLLVNSILLFCLFSPNIVYLIHKKHFNWKEIKNVIVSKDISITNLEKVNIFNVGEAVKINDKRFDTNNIYYLLEEYNNGTHWYVSTNPKDKERRCITMGVNIILIEKL